MTPSIDRRRFLRLSAAGLAGAAAGPALAACGSARNIADKVGRALA